MKTDMYSKTRHQGIIFKIMDQGGPTDDRESYVEDAVAVKSHKACFPICRSAAFGREWINLK